MLNKVILMGRLTRDPELRHTQNNTPVCAFCLAVARDRKDQNGEVQTDFIDFVAWGKLGEFVAKWFSKGVMAIVVGRLQSRKWQDKDGNNRTAIEVNCAEVTFGETKKAREQSGTYATPTNAPDVGYAIPDESAEFSALPENDADVPF